MVLAIRFTRTLLYQRDTIELQKRAPCPLRLYLIVGLTTRHTPAVIRGINLDGGAAMGSG
jgi:hypothetical protein